MKSGGHLNLIDLILVSVFICIGATFGALVAASPVWGGFSGLICLRVLSEIAYRQRFVLPPCECGASGYECEFEESLGVTDRCCGCGRVHQLRQGSRWSVIHEDGTAEERMRRSLFGFGPWRESR